MDKLSPLLSRFTLNARVFYSGMLCGTSEFDTSAGIGHLHLLREGSVKISQKNTATIDVTQPSVIFYPRPHQHRFEVKHQDGAELVCAEIDFGAGLGNPLVCSLPELIIIPLSDIAGLKSLLDMLFDEAFSSRCGRQTAVDRLTEYFLVLLLRHTIETQLIEIGVFAGLSDARLARAITAMHEKPEYCWTLEKLANQANMSRTRFAVNFRDTVGTTPLDYLTDWRVSVAQTLLKRGQPLKMIAPAVGYGSSIALTRVFSKRVGVSPAMWLEAQTSIPSPNNSLINLHLKS